MEQTGVLGAWGGWAGEGLGPAEYSSEDRATWEKSEEVVR